MEFRRIMKFRTWLRLRVMSKAEKEKRLDELNRKLRQPSASIGTHLEEIEEREWLKKKLGYGAL